MLRGRIRLFGLLALSLLIYGVSGSPSRALADGGPRVEGVIFFDLNRNGQQDPGEPLASRAKLSRSVTIPGAKSTDVSVGSDGHFAIDLPGTQSGYEYIIAASVSNSAYPWWPVAMAKVVEPIPLGQTRTIDLALQFGGSQLPGARLDFRQTNFAVGFFFQDYFVARGGVRTFGYPISRMFVFQGFQTQVFQRAVLQHWPDDSIHLLNLLDPEFLPFSSFNGAKVPAFDLTIAANAPVLYSRDYSTMIVDFVRENVPNMFNERPVNFWATYQNTVRYTDAFPSGKGDPHLLDGFNLEVWGTPTSLPMVDPTNNDFIYQRFQRGIMHYRVASKATEGVLLGEYFKEIMTGINLPSDIEWEARNSPFLRQYCPDGSNWVCRPDALGSDNNDLMGAFEREVE